MSKPKKARVNTPVGRASFAHVHEPDTYKKKTQYRLSLIFEPGTDFGKLKEEILKQARTITNEQFPISKIIMPIKDGDSKKWESYHGKKFLNAKSTFKVGIVGPDRKPLPEGDVIYSGCRCRANVSPSAYIREAQPDYGMPECRGVNLYLNSVQFIADDEPFGGNAGADFDDEYSIAANYQGNDENLDDDLPF